MNEENKQIVERFFEALQFLKENGTIRGEHTFVTKYGINNQNLYQLKQDMTRKIFNPCWLTYLVRDYGVSADWLLTGEGEILKNCK